MFPYILLVIATMIFSFVAYGKNVKGRAQIKLGYSEYIKNNNLSINVFFIILLLMLSFRDISIGRDLYNYEFLFNRYKDYGIHEVFTASGDRLYILLNWLVGKITDNYQILLIVVAVLSVVPICIEYTKDRRKSLLKLILYINMPVFILLFSGLRQCIALAVVMIAYECIKQKKMFQYFVLCIIALGFHHSAFIAFFLYPIYYLRLKKRHLYFLIPMIAVVFIFNKQIFAILLRILSLFSSGVYDATATSTGAYSFIILFAMFTIMAYILPDERQMDEETFGLRNYLTFALMLQCFALVHPLAMRMNYYFIMFIPLAIPKVLLCSKSNYREVAVLAEWVLIVFFLAYYLITAYQSCMTGESALDTYPYVPFWKN